MVPKKTNLVNDSVVENKQPDQSETIAVLMKKIEDMEKKNLLYKTLQSLQGIENQKKEDQNYLRKIKDYQNTILKLDKKDVDLDMLYSLITFLFIKTKFENIKEPGQLTSTLLRMRNGER